MLKSHGWSMVSVKHIQYICTVLWVLGNGLGFRKFKVVYSSFRLPLGPTAGPTAHNRRAAERERALGGGGSGPLMTAPSDKAQLLLCTPVQPTVVDCRVFRVVTLAVQTWSLETATKPCLVNTQAATLTSPQLPVV